MHRRLVRLWDVWSANRMPSAQLTRLCAWSTNPGEPEHTSETAELRTGGNDDLFDPSDSSAKSM